MNRSRRQLLLWLLAASFLLGYLYFPSEDPSDDSDDLYELSTFTGPDGQERFINPTKDEFNPDYLWRKLPVRNPVESIETLPTGNPKRMPRVQAKASKFSRVTSWFHRDRRDAVKEAFTRCWKAYHDLAWTTDELSPISGLGVNTMGGWGATLVDILDTLWIMDMHREFDEAVAAVSQISFEDTPAPEINTFDINVRHLGGLLGAYDLSGDRRLLKKAIEVGDMLYAAFDTPNRMPITHWDFHRAARQDEQLAEETALASELSSFTLEFTRLSQITRDSKYFDAANRIMVRFDQQQDMSQLPGMWPGIVNAREERLSSGNVFTLGAEADTLYEYLPKAYALLGGQVPMYRSMYEKSMRAAAGHTFFRPMNPDEKDILVSGTVHVLSTENGNPRTHMESLAHHRTCSAAGTFAFGSALFNIPVHMKIAHKLLDGCIWTSQSMPLGIMPELFETIPCASQIKCPWNERHWKQEVWKKANKDRVPDFDTDSFIKQHHLPKGFISIPDPHYNLRPEVIESMFLMYRITGRADLLDTAWDMFESIQNSTQTQNANAALADVTAQDGIPPQVDSMQSFWMAQTLKYFYLMFSSHDVISLDKYVFNTEGHPLKRPV
ncbi:uncharacterized protein PFLUO_LOCUS7854 [Penicillium psychrofluorescens]|uniref:uncharacterized protein n=1 Tax=Penicillium psychrofluorescens TaxID=3158075 RepID=UPI003CCCD1FD